jgi:hypothetical protein
MMAILRRFSHQYPLDRKQAVGLPVESVITANRRIDSSETRGAYVAEDHVRVWLNWALSRCSWRVRIKELFYSLPSLRRPSVGVSSRCSRSHILRFPTILGNTNCASSRTKDVHNNLDIA